MYMHKPYVNALGGENTTANSSGVLERSVSESESFLFLSNRTPVDLSTNEVKFASRHTSL